LKCQFAGNYPKGEFERCSTRHELACRQIAVWSECGGPRAYLPVLAELNSTGSGMICVCYVYVCYVYVMCMYVMCMYVMCMYVMCMLCVCCVCYVCHVCHVYLYIFLFGLPRLLCNLYYYSFAGKQEANMPHSVLGNGSWCMRQRGWTSACLLTYLLYVPTTGTSSTVGTYSTCGTVRGYSYQQYGTYYGTIVTTVT